MEQLIEWIARKALELLMPVPDWLWYSLAAVFLFVVVATLGLTLYRLAKGDELRIGNKFSVGPSKRIEELETALGQVIKEMKGALEDTKKEYEKIYTLSRQRRIMLDGTKDVLGDVAAFFNGALDVRADQFISAIIPPGIEVSTICAPRHGSEPQASGTLRAK